MNHAPNLELTKNVSGLELKHFRPYYLKDLNQIKTTANKSIANGLDVGAIGHIAIWLFVIIFIKRFSIWLRLFGLEFFNSPTISNTIYWCNYKMRPLLLFLSLLSLSVDGQKLPLVNFNHFYTVIDSTDLHALQNSEFIKNKFAALIIRTTKADNSETWTGTYLEGLDNYLELFDVTMGEPLGNAGIAFSVDRTGEINQLDSMLSKNYTIEKRLREKQYDNKKVPWFTGLGIKDSVFDSLSHISFWVMEYRPEYYKYNHWKHENNKLTRITYLSQYAEERRNKILKRFTGVTLYATNEEQQVISGFLLNCGYHKINDTSLVSPEHFVIHFIHRNINNRYAVASVEFETNMPLTDTINISESIEIRVKDTVGRIVFK